MLAHLRTEAYDLYAPHAYPPRPARGAVLSYEENVQLIEEAKLQLERRRNSIPAFKI